MTLNTADIKLLQQLQQDASIQLDALSHICGLSIASVQRRLKKLRESGIIAREVAVLEPKPLAQNLPQKHNNFMHFIVNVEMERERIDQLDTFKRIIKKEPQVQQCYYVTGEADFTLVCIARDMTDFEALTQRLFFNNGNIRRFKTSVVMDCTKVSLALPLE